MVKKKNRASGPNGLPFPIGPNLDEALRRAVSEVLSGMASPAQGAPMTYSINIRVDENGVPAISQASPDGMARKTLPADEWNPLIEVVEREKAITVIAEVAGVDRKDLRVRATPTMLEVCSVGKAGTVEGINMINLPKETDPSSAVARYRNGVLEMTVSKGKGPTARSVRIE